MAKGSLEVCAEMCTRFLACSVNCSVKVGARGMKWHFIYTQPETLSCGQKYQQSIKLCRQRSDSVQPPQVLYGLCIYPHNVYTLLFSLRSKIVWNSLLSNIFLFECSPDNKTDATRLVCKSCVSWVFPEIWVSVAVCRETFVGSCAQMDSFNISIHQQWMVFTS